MLGCMLRFGCVLSEPSVLRARDPGKSIADSNGLSGTLLDPEEGGRAICFSEGAAILTLTSADMPRSRQ